MSVLYFFVLKTIISSQRKVQPGMSVSDPFGSGSKDKNKRAKSVNEQAGVQGPRHVMDLRKQLSPGVKFDCQLLNVPRLDNFVVSSQTTEGDTDERLFQKMNSSNQNPPENFTVKDEKSTVAAEPGSNNGQTSLGTSGNNFQNDTGVTLMPSCSQELGNKNNNATGRNHDINDATRNKTRPKHATETGNSAKCVPVGGGKARKKSTCDDISSISNSEVEMTWRSQRVLNEQNKQVKHRPYHSWQLLVFRNPADFT